MICIPSCFRHNTWQAVLWQVLFPLLDNVIIQVNKHCNKCSSKLFLTHCFFFKFQSDNASSEKVSQSSSIMIHHSRNTAQKQWAETKVLTISGVVRVFNTKRKLLKAMDDYSKAWLLLLEYVEKMALSETTEVALAALKAMQEMILSLSDEQVQTSTTSATAASAAEGSGMKEINWMLCWKAWINIGTQKTKFMANCSGVTSGNLLLTGFIQIFNSLFPRLESQFRPQDAEALGKVLLSCVRVPSDHLVDAAALTPEHAAALEAVKITEVAALATPSGHALVPPIFEILFNFVSTGFGYKGEGGDGSGGNGVASGGKFREKISLFGEVASEHLGEFLLKAIDKEGLPLDRILYRTVEVFKQPLRLKYRCFRDSNWRVAINVLLKILAVGIPKIRPLIANNANVARFWSELSIVLEHFLFPADPHGCAGSEAASGAGGGGRGSGDLAMRAGDERMTDEAVDCQIIDLLREEVLPYPKLVPAAFIRKIVVLLNRGSIHSTIRLSEDCSGTVGLREDFAKQCFETLLDFSMLRSGDPSDDTDVGAGEGQESTLTNRLAITSLLQRFKEVLVDAIDGEKLNRNIPLQRQKTAEIAFVLRAIATVISSMKKASNPRVVDKKTWQQAIALYPFLVQCTETNSPQVSASVKDALMQYHDLLQPLGQSSV